MAGAWVAGLDGGGTKTAVALASRAGEVRILPPGAGCNPQDGPGWDGVLAALLAHAARVEGGLASAVLGIPGRGEVPAHDAAVDGLLSRALACPHEAMNDVALAHLGAFGGGEGVLLLAGTGSMAWARGPGGEARVGGWGHAFGDEGSAHWIGREMLATASKALDGRARRDLAFAHALCARLGPDAQGPFGPLQWLMVQPGTPRSAIAGVARQVDYLALMRHGAAREIVKRAAASLASHAYAAAEQAGLERPLPWVASGGALRNSRLLALVTDHLGSPLAPRLTTLGGGLLHAARLAGWEPDAAWAARVDARLRAFAG